MIARFIKKLAKALLFRPRVKAIGADSYFKRPWRVKNGQHLSIGSASSVGRNCKFEAITEYAGVKYNPSVVIGNNVYISDSSHGMDIGATPMMSQPLTSRGPVHIGNDVFIGIGSFIAHGVTLGDHLRFVG